MMETPTKISGYLEKKGSLKMISSWKKYWFVLEGQLLLYYRSKDEYEGISPCKGTINLCPPCFIKPCNSEKCVFRIEKKTNSITLRAKNRLEQDKWMQGLLTALKSNSLSQSRLSHYRFSACEFGSSEKQRSLQRHRSMPTRYNRNDFKSYPEVLERLREMGARTHTVHMPKNKLVRRYGSGGQLYASIGDCPAVQQEGQEKPYNVDGFLVNNDIYEAPERVLCRKLSVCYESTESAKPSICDVSVVDNEQCGAVVKRSSFSESSTTPKDYDYCSISPSKDSYYNRNTIVIENEQYVSSLLFENFGNTNLTEEAIYEEIDKIREKLGFPQDDYAEILDNTSTTEEQLRKTKRTLLRNKKNSEQKRSLKKRRSFFGKLMHKWKKRRKVIMDQHEMDRDMKILLELQQILSQRKAALEQTSNATEPNKKEESDPVFKKDDAASIEPALPPKTLSKHSSPYHDTPRNNNPVFLQNIPPNASLDEEETIRQQKSIDEILDDLNKEKEEQDSRPNVKKMIERFSSYKDEEEEVVLRRQKQQKDKSNLRHSDDLNDLLEKLGEMTVAPPMAPGVTSSLATPPVSDEEWLKLLPIRKRRMSDPDYDIPRPHRSLVFEPKTEDSENVIPATRFFGPVLQSSDYQSISKCSSPTCVSISPDSLEIIEKCEQTSHVENISYTSHFYPMKPPKHYDHVIFVHSKWRPVENDSIGSSNEIFVDSLEAATELSTAF